jgi:hypothetical protein
LAAEQLERWRKWQIFSEDDISRMQEVELTSEICIAIIEKKIMGKSTTMIENYYKKFDETYPNKSEVEKRYRATMDFIFHNFQGNKNDFVFFKKTIFYTFFIICYDFLFSLNTPVSHKEKSKSISAKQINDLKVKGDRIKKRSAPDAVLEATDRRTTNPKERDILFNYLKA